MLPNKSLSAFCIPLTLLVVSGGLWFDSCYSATSSNVVCVGNNVVCW